MSPSPKSGHLTKAKCFPGALKNSNSVAWDFPLTNHPPPLPLLQFHPSYNVFSTGHPAACDQVNNERLGGCGKGKLWKCLKTSDEDCNMPGDTVCLHLCNTVTCTVLWPVKSDLSKYHAERPKKVINYWPIFRPNLRKIRTKLNIQRNKLLNKWSILTLMSAHTNGIPSCELTTFVKIKHLVAETQLSPWDLSHGIKLFWIRRSDHKD